jgi:predicted transcriptional regulator
LIRKENFGMEQLLQIESQIKKLNQFIVNNSDLEKLEVLMKEFNPLRILKVNNYEIRHSNMLAWLLDPSENHNLGDLLLKKVLVGVLSGEVEVSSNDITIPQVLMSNFHDATVLREWKNIDLVIESKSNDMILFIENKVHAGLGKHQLQKYIKIIKESYPNCKNIIPVFLTLTGEESSHPNYYKYSHIEICSLLTNTLKLYKNRINGKVYDFISYYINVLEELTMQDDRLINLCKDIYKNHKEAIDLIFSYGMIPSSSYHDALQVVREELDLVDYTLNDRYSKSNNEYWFLPASLLEIGISNTLPFRWKSPLALSYFFVKEENRLKLFLEVGPMADTEKRLDFLNHLNKSELFTPNQKALTNLNGKYTKIKTGSINFNEWDDVDAIQIAVRNLLNNFKFEKVNRELERLVREFNTVNSF